MSSLYIELLKEIGKEEGINILTISKDWIVVLEKNSQIKFIVGYKFPNNSYSLGAILDDKYAFYEFLKLQGLPVVEHHILYGQNNNCLYAEGCKGEDVLYKLFDQYKKVVLKTNNGTCGKDVYYFLDYEELKEKYLELSKKHFSCVLSPFIEIENEYRVIVLKNKIECIYKKELPILYGDGKSTIKELLEKFNPSYFKDYNQENKDVILKKGEKFVYNWKFNLPGGARINPLILEDVKKEIVSLVDKFTTSLNVGFCSLDIVKTKEGDYYFLEGNSGVMMENFIIQYPNGKKKAKEIYRKAILASFESRENE